MSRRPPWLNRGGAARSTKKASTSGSSNPSANQFAAFYRQLVSEAPDGLDEAKGGHVDDDEEEEPQSSHKKSTPFQPQQRQERVLRLFSRQNGDYFTVHGGAAYFVADEYFRTRIDVRWSGDDKLASLNLRPSKVASIVSDAVRVQKMQVEVWSKEQGEWICIKKGSPANIAELEDLMGSRHEEDAPVMAVTLTVVNQQRMVGVAFVDGVRYRLEVAEFGDDSQFSSLESVLIQRSPRSCILQPDKKSNTQHDMNKMRELLEKTNTAREDSKMSVGYNEEKFMTDLPRVVDDIGRYPLLVSTQPYAMSALASLIQTLALSTSLSSSHRYTLYAFNVHQHCKLDHSSFTALNLFPLSTTSPFASSTSSSSSSSSSSSDLSIFSFLNRTKTPMGGRLLSRFIRQPLLSIADITLRHDVVSFFASHTSIRSHLRESSTCLRRCPDVESILRKLQREKAKLLDVVRLYQVVVKVGVMREALQGELEGEDSAVVRTRYVDPLHVCEVEMEQFVAMCDRAIDMEMSERTWYAEVSMRGDFSPDLKTLEGRKSSLRRQMEAIQKEVEEALGLQGKVNFDFLTCHLRITNKEENRARLRPPYIIIDSKKDGTRFTTPPLKALATEYKAVVREYGERQQLYVEKLIETTLTYEGVVERMSGLIAELDVLVAFAHVATALEGFVRPTMKEMGTGVLRMKASRHPLLENANLGTVKGSKTGDDDEGMPPSTRSFIPNDVEIIQGISHLQIITGPNMIGMFVPAQLAELTVVDAILCRIGAGDIQSKGEMLETAQILHLASPTSLVIVDEMGRGTSTEDGLGLAWATAEFLARRGSFSLFATHFHEMRALAEEGVGAVNKHVTALIRGGMLEYLYEVREGASEESFGVECMELAKMPQRLVSNARKKLRQFEEERRRGGGPSRGRAEEEEELKRNVQELKLRVETLRMRGGAHLSDVERLREKESIRAEATELERRLRDLTQTAHTPAVDGRNGSAAVALI